MQRKYPDKLTKELFTAAKSGDAVLLSEVLQQTNSSERTSVLDRERYHLLSDEIMKCTPLTLAALNGNLDCVKLLLKYKAEVNRKDESDISNERWTPLGVAATNGHVDVVKFLVANGADVNSCTNYNCTPLMLASQNGHVNVVTILVEYGANMDLQDSNGDTALHYAVRGNSSDVVHRLLNLGASQLFNNQRLTPLLLACNRCMISVVEDLIKSPECTKEQRIDALELLGASMAVSVENDENDRAFQYMKRGMKERFEDPSNPLFKQPMEPIEAYQNRKESQTLEEVAQIEGDNEAIMMEGFVIRERILGQDNLELLDPIRKLTEELQFAGYYYYYDICIGLCIHAMKIAQRHHQSAVFALECLTNAFCNMVLDHNHPPSQMVLLKVLELTIREYKKERETLSAKIENGRLSHRRGAVPEKTLSGHDVPVFHHILRLLLFLAKDELCGEHCKENKNSSMSFLLQKLCSLNPRDGKGNTLLHIAAGGRDPIRKYLRDPDNSPLYGFPIPCVKTVELLLNAGFNVNAINSYGDTPLHRAATFNPGDWKKYHLITDMLQVLLDGGAHHDFTNNDGNTAMDVAINVRAYNFLSYTCGKKLELKCISARAVKKFGLPYLGEVPKTLEKYISMH